MPPVLTVLGHKIVHFLRAFQLPPLSLDQLSTHTSLTLFWDFEAMSQGMCSGLSLTKGPEIGGGSTQWGKFCPKENGRWKWLGQRNSSFILSSVSYFKTQFLSEPFTWPMDEWMCHSFQCLCGSLWSCTQHDGYTHCIALPPSLLASLFLILMAQSLYLPNKVITP